MSKQNFNFKLYIVNNFREDQQARANQQLFEEAVRQVSTNIQGQLPDFIRNALVSQNNETMSKLSASIERFTEKTSAGETNNDWLVFLIHKSFFKDGTGATIFTMPERLDTKFKFTYAEFDTATSFLEKLNVCQDKFKPSGLIIFPPADPTVDSSNLPARLESAMDRSADFSPKQICFLLPTTDKSTATKLLNLRYKYDNVILADQRFLCTTSGEPSTFKLINSCIRSLENALKLSDKHHDGFTIVESKERSFGHSTPRGGRGQKRRGNFGYNNYNNGGYYYNKRGRGSY